MTNSFRSHQNALEELWNQGLSGHSLLRRYTQIADEFIIDLFNKAIAEHQPGGELAIIALGGYGRRELYPYSDIDLLLLYDRKSKKKIRSISEVILYPLWDEGLDVGHSVRSVKDAVAFAKEDFVFQVSLLDARLLAGSASLFEELEKKYKEKIFEGRRSNFVETMEQFRAERRDKYGSHAYLLEPHIKEGKGGMRDIQAMTWVAKGVFGLRDLDAIEASAMISSDDRQAFEASWNMLVRIRNQLHYLRRRKDDQLIFEFQEEMATLFGYTDHDGLLAVEHFMRDVYNHLQTVAIVTDLFFEQVQEVLGMAGDDGREQLLEHSIISRSRTVRLRHVEDLDEKPYLLMRLFLQSGRTGYPLHHRTRTLVSSHLHLVDDRFRSSRRVARIFFEILTGSKDVFMVMETMLECGLLTSYIPEFATIECLAQHDLYHIYTVDRHQIQTLAELHLLMEEKASLFAFLEEPRILFLAALLHDVGKGKQTDHSERGAAMVELVGRRLQLDREQRALLAFVVQYHLFMPENAMRRDLSDQRFIQQTAELIGDTQRLTMLYLISIADSKATGPSAWSSWKSSLLSELYLQTRTCLEGSCHTAGPHTDGREQQGIDWLRDQLRKQLGETGKIGIAVENLPDDYLICFTPEKVLQHLRIHKEQKDNLHSRVLLFPHRQERSWSLLIMTSDRTGLLSRICGVLALHNLRVLAAQIFTWPDETVVDMIEITSSYANKFDDIDWDGVERDCNLAINGTLDVAEKLKARKQPMVSTGSKGGRTAQVQQVRRTVVIDNHSSQNATIIEAYGQDFYGAMYRFTQVLADFSLSIHRAKVATEVEQMIVIFYVTMADGGKLEDESLQQQVKDEFLTIIG